MTIGGAHVFSDASWLDPVGGLLISGMVIKAGWNNTKNALLELGDVTVDDEVKVAIKKAATKVLQGDVVKDLPGVSERLAVEIKEIQGVKSGQNYLMEIELAVAGDSTVEQTYAIECAVREKVGATIRGVRRLKVRFTALERDISDFAEEFIGADVSPRSSPEPEHEHLHDKEHDHDDRSIREVNDKKSR